jgi:hypothetical protein
VAEKLEVIPNCDHLAQSSLPAATLSTDFEDDEESRALSRKVAKQAKKNLPPAVCLLLLPTASCPCLLPLPTAPVSGPLPFPLCPTICRITSDLF